MLALLVLLLVLPPLLHALPLSARPACPVILPVTRQVTPRVIGGEETTSAAAPFAIALSGPLSEASTRRLCTGARLSQLWVVTAAHCGVDTTWTAQLPGGTTVAIAQAYTHEGYKEVTDRVYDIAVLLLSPADVPDGAEIVRVNTSPALPKAGAFVRVTGFGASKDEGPSVDVLRRVDVPVVPFAKCVEAYAFSEKTGKMDGAAQMCSGYLTAGGCDSCDGDSGGPVIQYNAAGDPVLVAVVSAGRGCALPDFPGINLRIDNQMAWMKEKGVEFETEDKAVQVVLDGGYPDTPPDEKVPKPSPKPSPSPSPSPSPLALASSAPPAQVVPPPLPPPASASESAAPESRPSPDSAPEPEKTRQPRPRPERSPAAPSEDTRPGGNQELPAAVVAPAPSASASADSADSADAARPTRTPTPAPGGGLSVSEEEGSGVAASANPSATPSGPTGGPTLQEEDATDATAEAAGADSGGSEDDAQNGGPGGAEAELDGGELDDGSEGKAASTGGDARVAGIVAGALAGVVLISGVVVFIVKTR